MKRPIGMLIALALVFGITTAAVSQETQTPANAVPSAPVPPSHSAETKPSTSPLHSAIAAKVKELSAKEPATVAAAAYWLGEQGSAAIEAIPQLAAVLGDNRQVNAARYRKHVPPRSSRAETSSPGEEAAAALAKIGDPAVGALINVLKSSPSAVARQNAAWALGVIQDRHNMGLDVPSFSGPATHGASSTTPIEGIR